MWIVSVEECSSLMQNLMQIFCSTHSVILNAMATQYTCPLNGIYGPQWLVQWSYHCSHWCIPISPWLPGYINVMQTYLVILAMVALFPDRSHMSQLFWQFYDNPAPVHILHSWGVPSTNAVITHWVFNPRLTLFYYFIAHKPHNSFECCISKEKFHQHLIRVTHYG